MTVVAGPGERAGSAPARSAGRDTAAALYDVHIHHVRTTPLRNAFRYRSYQWLVDLDALPALPLPLRPFASFEARDHLGDPERSLRENVDSYLADKGIDLRGGQIRMLANARILGYVFNPLSVFWCHDPDGSLRCVIAEVHNTYGQRHRYLLQTDARGRADTEKQFYVSPFYEVAGRYTMSLPEPGKELRLSITLHPPQGATFVASVQGVRRPARGFGVVRMLLGRPWTTAAVSVRIRWQGIKLYVRGLPVVPRRFSSPTKEHG
ncbi:MAG TPA: DUF1365 domain-containing protein [Frankiaceae bacterium]|nr:DUF1365 domain-containing protein [Frankiaceae bacterium]